MSRSQSNERKQTTMWTELELKLLVLMSACELRLFFWDVPGNVVVCYYEGAVVCGEKKLARRREKSSLLAPFCAVIGFFLSYHSYSTI